MGESTLSAAQLADWFASTGSIPKLDPGTTIANVARYFVEEGNAEHVRGDLAFAQAIIETGSFAVAAGNNFSGIGVCDSCQGGYGFATPRDGVRGQIQLLRNYADPASRADNLAYPPSPALYGTDPDKAERLYDTFFLKGKAPLWNLMGGGNWATDPTYAPKVIGAVLADGRVGDCERGHDRMSVTESPPEVVSPAAETVSRTPRTVRDDPSRVRPLVQSDHVVRRPRRARAAHARRRVPLAPQSGGVVGDRAVDLPHTRRLAN